MFACSALLVNCMSWWYCGHLKRFIKIIHWKLVSGHVHLIRLKRNVTF